MSLPCIVPVAASPSRSAAASPRRLASTARIVTAMAALTVAGGCALAGRGGTRRPVVPPGFADSVRTERLAGGALLHTIVNLRAPWRAYVVEQDLSCGSVRAIKGSGTAVGRTTTSALLANLSADERAYAALNADFFLFAPPGVLTNLHVEQGALLAGPGPKPVFTFDGLRQFAIDTIVVRGALMRGRDTVVALRAWNRPVPRQNGIVDARWGVPIDTVVRTRVYRLVPLAARAVDGGRRMDEVNGRYTVAEAAPRDTLVQGDTVLLHLDARAQRANAVRAGDTLQLSIGLTTVRGAAVAIREAVGGRPIVLRDSAITADVNTEGNEGFRNLNPRTAVALDRNGRRAWYAVIDGRQPGYSMGMTLRQVGELMQAMGATSALNLDGGGSSALAIRDPDTRRVRVVNRPSDKVERPVGNALALLARCERL